jgi:hypothetical protein
VQGGVNDDTLIVSASYDDFRPEWFEAFPEPKVRVSTSDGGYQHGAYVDAFRFDRKRHHSYLFVQDSMEVTHPAPVAIFRAEAQNKGVQVVGWAGFPFFFDNLQQQSDVMRQYPYTLPPERGMFGPVFWVERKVLEMLDKRGLIPKKPWDKNSANGTERAWAVAFKAAGIPVAYLHDWSEAWLSSGDAAPFKKHYQGRQ